MSLEARIDEAVRLGATALVVERIKEDLARAIRGGDVTLPGRFRRTKGDSYARRLLFRSPEYTAVVMTWGPGQRTAVHDHAGIWCVEGVVEGEMNVIQYELQEESGGRCRFQA
ncbi:MAG: cysteine dioxygenase, partial [Bryobacteraceae bacterium]